MKKLILIACLVLTHFISSGQTDYLPGFIIKNNGDSVAGLIFNGYNRQFEKKCRFRRFEIAEEFVYGPDQIKAYGFRKGRRFEAKTINNRSMFYECLVSGPVILYSKPSDQDVMYIESKRDGFIKLREGTIRAGNNTFSDYRQYLASVTNTTADINPAGYNSQSVSAYLKKSNISSVVFPRTLERSFLTTTSLTKNSPLWHVGLSGGYQFLTVYIEGNRNFLKKANYNFSYRPVTGIFINKGFSRRSDLFSIDLGLQFYKDTYYGFAEYKDTWTYKDQIFIDFTSIQFPFALKFTLGKKEKELRTVIKIGGYTSYLLDYNYARYSLKFVDENVYTQKQSDFESKSDKGLLAGAGLETPLGLRKLGVDVIYSRGWQKLEGHYHGMKTTIKTNCFQIMLKLSL